MIPSQIKIEIFGKRYHMVTLGGLRLIEKKILAFNSLKANSCILHTPVLGLDEICPRYLLFSINSKIIKIIEY